MPERAGAARPGRSALLGLAIWGLAVAVALLAQRLLTPQGQVEEGALVFLLAAALAVAGVGLIDRTAPPKPDGEPSPQPAIAAWPWAIVPVPARQQLVKRL